MRAPFFICPRSPSIEIVFHDNINHRYIVINYVYSNYLSEQVS